MSLKERRDRTLAYSGVKVQSRFYPGDLVTRTGDREIRSVSGTLPDYAGGLACMRGGHMNFHPCPV